MALFDYVQSNTGRAVSAPAVGFVSSVTAGNLIIVAILAELDTTTISSVVDNKGNTYTRASFKVRTGLNYSEIWYAVNVSGGSSFTVTVTGSAGGVIAHIHEFVGSSGTSLDAHNEALSASTSVTTTGAADLLFGFGNRNAGGYPTAGSGFTNREQFVFNYYSYTENKTSSGSGSNTIDFSASDAILGVAFKGSTTFTSSVNATATQTATVAKQAKKSVAAQSSTGTATIVKQPNKAVAVNQSNVVTLTKRPNKNISAATSNTVSLSRLANKIVALATAAVITVLKKANRTLAAVNSANVATVTKQPNKNISANTASTSSVARFPQKVFALATAVVITIPRLIAHKFGVIATSNVATVTKQSTRSHSRTTANVVTLTKRPNKNVSASTVNVVSLLRLASRIITRSTAVVVSLIKQGQIVVRLHDEQAIKAFWFNVNAEGWVATPGNGRIAMFQTKYRKRSQGTHPRSWAPITTLAGSLHTVAQSTTPDGIAPAATNYWSLTTTWAALGASAPVTKIKADYLFQVRQAIWRKASAVPNTATFAAGDVKSGPFELRVGGVLIATLSPAVSVPARGFGNYWKLYPASTDGASSTSPGSWYKVVGYEVNIPPAYQATSTTIELRLKTSTPATEPCVVLEGEKTIRVRHNGVIISMV